MPFFSTELSTFVAIFCVFGSSSVLQDAFVEFLKGSYLFESMLKDDPEAETIHCVPGVAPLLHTYPLLSLLSNPRKCLENDK